MAPTKLLENTVVEVEHCWKIGKFSIAFRQTGFNIQWWVKLAVVGAGCTDTRAEDCWHDSA